MLKDNIKWLLYYSGYYKLHALRRKPPDHRLLIIMYHDLVPDNSSKRPYLSSGNPSQSQFRAHLKAIGKLFRISSIEEAAAVIRNKGKLENPTACITFDDGCRSVYELAFPVLHDLGVSATVYLPTDWINRRMIPWWILLKNSIMRWNPDKIPPEAALKGLGLESNFDYDKSGKHVFLKRHLVSKLENRMRSKAPVEIEREIEKIKAVLEVDLKGELIGNDPMYWEQIREMSSAGISFGAHTRTHINLKYADKNTAEREIIESKKEIEQQLSVEVRGFAYPYGLDLDIYAGLGEMLQKNGFDYACTAAYGSNNPGDNLYLLRRISLPQATSPALLGRALILDYY